MYRHRIDRLEEIRFEEGVKYIDSLGARIPYEYTYTARVRLNILNDAFSALADAFMENKLVYFPGRVQCRFANGSTEMREGDISVNSFDGEPSPLTADFDLSFLPRGIL